MTTQLTRLLEPSDHAEAWRSLKDALGRLERASSSSGAGQARWMEFFTRTRERMSIKQLPRPIIALLLDGSKRILLDGPHGNTQLVAREGQILLMPPGVPLEVVNEPDPERGVYRTFAIELLCEVDERLQRRYPTLCVQRGLGGFEADRPHLLRSALPSIQALIHLVNTLLLPGAHALLITHRLEDLVLTLLLQHREQLEEARTASSTLALDPTLAVRTLVRRDPARPWTVEDVARALGVSNATLRRRLGARGLSFRALLWKERLDLARTLLRSGRHGVLEVATACGYDSASRFAEQFRRSEGVSPSEYRAQHRASSPHERPHDGARERPEDAPALRAL
ncbi:helix-turn-helix transcriptional regulator [Sorangium sp. So ce131]|uniref:helix-turn-helix transcriptional regulator n=1 Tax=Sorangium sp. So ce131 TaxID=3133282 RepID=UPI003F6485A1